MSTTTPTRRTTRTAQHDFPLDKLPDDILREICPFLPCYVQSQLSKSHYEECRPHIVESVRTNYKKYNRFIRKIIRVDRHTMLEPYLYLDGQRWYRMKRWREDGDTHRTYLHFLIHLCISFQSTQCRELISRLLYREHVLERQELGELAELIGFDDSSDSSDDEENDFVYFVPQRQLRQTHQPYSIDSDTSDTSDTSDSESEHEHEDQEDQEE